MMMAAPARSDVAARLHRATAVMDGAVLPRSGGGIGVGVDLGTAFTVLVAVDDDGEAVGGDHMFGSVTRDGVVVDFHGAVRMLRDLRDRVEQRLGIAITHGASGFPPGVAPAERRAVVHVLGEAGIECTDLVDEPTAANEILGITDGAVVDVGGGTTGVAVFRGGELVAVADEPTGGTQATLVIAGHFGITIDEAERCKRDPERQADLAPVLRPVWEKVATIVAEVVEPFAPPVVHLVGGTCRFPGIREVIAASVKGEVIIPGDPMFVTALGFAQLDLAKSGARP